MIGKSLDSDLPQSVTICVSFRGPSGNIANRNGANNQPSTFVCPSTHRVKPTNQFKDYAINANSAGACCLERNGPHNGMGGVNSRITMADVPDMLIHFFPDNGRPSWGVTDQQGKYVLDFDPEHQGAQAGKHRVHVEFRAADPGQEHLERTGQSKASDIRGTILEKYSEEKSQLTVNVDRDHQVIDLKLD